MYLSIFKNILFNTIYIIYAFVWEKNVVFTFVPGMNLTRRVGNIIFSNTWKTNTRRLSRRLPEFNGGGKTQSRAVIIVASSWISDVSSEVYRAVVAISSTWISE